MGNRQDKSSSRYGMQRDRVKEEKSKEHYKTRASRRLKQLWDAQYKVWRHLEKV